MGEENFRENLSRRNFFKQAAFGLGGGMLASANAFGQTGIQGFDEKDVHQESGKVWTPVSDRKIKVGIIGYGVCAFGAAFGFQHHPNVEVAAVSDLIPERCDELARVTNCKKKYPSLEELVKDNSIEAVFIATDAPSHVRHCIEALNRGKHVACAVPAAFGSLEDAQKLFETVKRTGLKYMMMETSAFRPNLYAMRKIYDAGGFGKILYAEGEYWHYSKNPIPSYNNWRTGLPPQWYPTHSDAYYIAVTNKTFLKVSCTGIVSDLDEYKKNEYNNHFATEISVYKTSDGGVARMVRSADTIGYGYGDETGRIRGTLGSFYDKYQGNKKIPDISRPAIPPSMKNRFYSNHHGGAHAYLTDEFVQAILTDRKPLVDIAMALNMTVGGIVAHQSALNGGQWLNIPQFKF